MTSERSSSVLLESGDEEAYPLGYEYVLDEPFGSERESSTSSSPKEEVESNPLERVCRKIFLLEI